QLKPGMIAIDVGAHVGYYTRLFSDLVGPTGRVYAFEANPLNFSLLHHNTFRHANVEMIHRAVSNRIGQATLYVSSKSGSHSLYQSEFTQDKVQVETETLDHFWKRIGSPEIGLIKIDVEGAEPSVLAGAEYLIKSHNRTRLIIEFAPTNLGLGGSQPAELIRSLRELNLSYRVISCHGELQEEIPDLERYELVNLFCWKGTL
ncbi:MAG TPA: FkbM family methyltransferase, partial [Acidobacteriota bacterium]|nr:FkbM family methyltransferase [Acidobacteriota bacterium]